MVNFRETSLSTAVFPPAMLQVLFRGNIHIFQAKKMALLTQEWSAESKSEAEKIHWVQLGKLEKGELFSGFLFSALYSSGSVLILSAGA